MESVVSEHGPWTAHNIRLGKGLCTMPEGQGLRYKRRSEIYEFLYKNTLNKDIDNIKVLDLGCLEGGIGIHFGLKGADVTGIDIRKSNIEKCRFASESLGIADKIRWKVADVCESDVWRDIGKFDLVICSGLLYHIDSDAILPFLQNIAKAIASGGILIVDTNIASKPKQSFKLQNGEELFGCKWKEHEESTTLKDRLMRAWSSLKNNEAFWLTERSLTNALVLAGFKYIFRSLYPYHEWGHQSRDIWVAKRDVIDSLDLPLRIEPDKRPIDHPGLK